MEKDTYHKNIKLLYEIVNELMQLLLRTNLNGPCLVFAKAVLIRLKATYEATEILLEKSFKIESFLLIRFIQEQIAYSYSASEKIDINDLDKVSVTKSIKNYINRFSKYGELYGELSRFAHLGKEKAFSYINISIIDSYVKMQILQNSVSDDEYYEMFLYYYFAVSLYVDMVDYLINKEEYEVNKEKILREIASIRYKFNKLIKSEEK